MTTATLETILESNCIDRCDWCAIADLVFAGKRPCQRVLTSLRHKDNYGAAIHAVMVELSKQVTSFKFPPENYQPKAA